MNPISSNMRQPKWGMFYTWFKLNINCNLFFFSPNPLQSDCLTAGKLHMLSTGNYFVCFVSERAFRARMWRAERTLSQSCLFDCRLASAFDVFNFIVRVCPHVFFFFFLFGARRPSPATPTPRAPSATSCSRESWRASSGSSR